MQEPHNQASNEEQMLPGTDDISQTGYSGDSAGGTERAGEEVPLSLEQQLKDAEITHKYAIDNFSTQLLAVMDSLDAALATENSTLENMQDGVELTRKQLLAVFEKFNIHTIDPQGEKFDPHQHEAMCAVESDLPANTVMQVMQKGYVLHDRVIRPAMVAVSKAKGT
ncbi:nucleotide exchange factor GrpE [Nitrosomonas sp.]|uniref:nucleotide exchange factor GrpE n=1 Tax=Nitrosomonas sp. TaxID=42353 RepID=UPI00261CCB29|nr:nucleotide exchange factor GrpE [Nitrosomonas sp.]